MSTTCAECRQSISPDAQRCSCETTQIARGHRLMMAGFVTYLVGAWIQAEVPLLAKLVSLAALGLTMSGVCMIGGGLRWSRPLTLVTMLLLLAPLVNVLVLLQVSATATGALMKAIPRPGSSPASR